MKSKITLIPISSAKEFANQPLDWSIKLWGEGKEEFSAPLVNDSYFTGLTDGQELCLDFDLFRCENLQTPGGGGGPREWRMG